MTNEILRGYTVSPNGQLHYRCTGEGEPLLLLHQTASSSEQFEPLMPTLAATHRVLALDTPGYGMSDPLSHQCTIADYARSVVDFLDALQIEQTSIFGRHTGAAIACEVAAAYPHRVDKLIVYGVPYYEEPIEAFQVRLRRFHLKEDGSHLTEVWDDVTSRIREGLFPKPYAKEALEIIEREVIWWLMAGERYHEGYVAIHLYNIMERLTFIQAPTLVMGGEQDRLRPALEPVATRIQRVRTRVVQGGSQFTTYDNPEALSREILNFLEYPGV